MRPLERLDRPAVRAEKRSWIEAGRAPIDCLAPPGDRVPTAGQARCRRLHQRDDNQCDRQQASHGAPRRPLNVPAADVGRYDARRDKPVGSIDLRLPVQQDADRHRDTMAAVADDVCDDRPVGLGRPAARAYCRSDVRPLPDECDRLCPKPVLRRTRDQEADDRERQLDDDGLDDRDHQLGLG